MNVEIAICTWNRCKLLDDTLKSIQALEIPDNVSVRIILVDNNSTDQTQQVAQSHAGHLDLECVREPTQGHAPSRNRAIETASGDLLVWTDDDVQVDKRWIQEYVAASRQFPDASFFGGPIQPLFRPDCPNWITENWDKLKGCFAERLMDEEVTEFSSEMLPYGANFAVRTDVQKQFRFDHSTGRVGGQVVGDDELSMMRRMISSGLTGRWVPRAKLTHVIDRSRQTADFVRDYFVGQGRTLVARGEPWTTDVHQLKRESRWELMCSRLKRPFADSDTWVSHLIRGALAQGQYDALVAKCADE